MTVPSLVAAVGRDVNAGLGRGVAARVAVGVGTGRTDAEADGAEADGDEDATGIGEAAGAATQAARNRAAHAETSGPPMAARALFGADGRWMRIPGT